MKVAVVGAGVAGLAAARKLTEAGIETVVLEKGGKPGGRCVTIERDGFVFDVGPTSIAPRGMSLEPVLLDKRLEGLEHVVKPVYTHQAGKIVPGDPIKNTIVRYCFRQGIAQLGTILSDGVDIRFDTLVESIEQDGDAYKVNGESFDAAVIAIPLVKGLAMVQELGFPLPETSYYRPCLSVALGLKNAIETPYHALIGVDNSHPIAWLSIESQKVEGRAPVGCSAIVAQFGPSYSRWNEESPEEKVLNDAMIDVCRLLKTDDLELVCSHVKFWRYSQPERTVQQSTVNRGGGRVVFAGDGVIGGRIEQAYESGIVAADLLVERLK